MTRLSVNINKIATLRNSRGANNPNVIKTALDCERFGAEGITVHPRPDERHIRYEDVRALKKVIKTEFNIEGNPDKKFIDLVIEVKPAQVTLVPDEPGALTSNQGWDTMKHLNFLKEVTKEFQRNNIRVSLFVDPVVGMVEGAAIAGADRVELYTEPYAKFFTENKEMAIADYLKAAETASKAGLGLNAGHDLDLNNLHYLKEKLTNLDEVSIGHALICDALYYGLENTIQLYLRKLK
ncbi:MAG TPA: pyridoxine 5'-phosphate synthase [Cytophagaceae bacterium]|jgi:pyridoxine 5-phosphate synthase|nr:pyridoxine 5'-phosphate synthase [Cytophagaceae bacterium]